MDFSREPLFLGLIVISCLTVLAEPVIGVGAQSGFSEEENYNYVKENWNGSEEIDFDEYWKGENKWGGYHIVYPVQLNTKKLIAEGRMRSDCTDIRVASEGQLLGTRVQDNTCNTSETWVYFGNPDLGDGLVFDENESIEDIEIFYGNKNAGLSKYTTSVYNDDIATVLKPESALGMYYGHHTSVYTDQETNLEDNDRDAPEQEWSVDFETDHGDTGTSEIHISDQDGNSESFSSSDTYTITSSNAPSWVDQGDTLDVYFTSQEVCYSGCSAATSDVESAQWGYPVQFDNPRPAKSNYGSPVDSTSPNLDIDVDQPSGNDVTVSFYDASNGNFIGSDTVYGGLGTATAEWSGLSDGGTYNWYAEACSSGCKQTASNFEFDVNGIPSIEELNFDDSPSDHQFEAVARVRDGDGYSDLDSCSVDATDQSGNSNSYNSLGFDSGSGNEAYCRVTINYDDLSSWSHLANLDVEFTVSDSKNTVSDQDPHTFPNHDPSVVLSSGNFNDYSDRHAFNISADLTFPDDQAAEPDPAGACRIILEGENTGGQNLYNSSVDPELDADFTYLGGNNGVCDFSRVEPDSCKSGNCNGDFNFDVQEQIDVTVKAFDSHGAVGQQSYTNEIPNSVPTIDSLLSPTDGGIVVGEDANLEITASDDEGDSFNVTFFDDDTGNTIETLENVDSSSTLATIWSVGLGEHQWGVNVSDHYSGQTISTWSFRRVISDSFRLEKGIEYRYSSLIVSEFSSSSVMLEVINTHPTAKNITTDVSAVQGNVNISFSSYDGSVYTLESGGSKRFQVEVSRDEEVNGYAEDTLKFNSTDQQIGAETVEEFPVYVKNSQQESRGVPGLTATMIYVIGLVSVLLFGLSV